VAGLHSAQCCQQNCSAYNWPWDCTVDGQTDNSIAVCHHTILLSLNAQNTANAEKLIVAQRVSNSPAFYETRVHKASPLAPSLSHMNPVQTHILPLWETFNATFPSMSWSTKLSLPLGFSDWNSVRISDLPHARRMSRSFI